MNTVKTKAYVKDLLQQARSLLTNVCSVMDYKKCQCGECPLKASVPIETKARPHRYYCLADLLNDIANKYQEDIE